MRTSYLMVLLSVLFIFIGCPEGGDDDTSTSDDDVADDDIQDDDATGDDDTSVGTDADGDGWTVQDGDCDDGNEAIHPDAEEGCDGIDTDCDGNPAEEEVDDDADGAAECEGDCDDTDASLNLDDLDGDGVDTCSGDCDDEDETSYPGAEEVCDGVPDNDCDGGSDPQETDDDGDGATECDGDCDDTDADLNLDDLDGDGVDTCAGDCDDDDETSYPGANEVCDDIDNDCNGTPDDGLEFDTYYPDLDGDLHGDEADAGEYACAPQAGWVADNTDCDDSDDTVHEGATELCDAIDNDCDQALPDDEEDGDSDGYMICENDCDDDDSTIYPTATEDCNGVDDDCDGAVPSEEDDADGDGVRVCDGDCDDADAANYPGNEEDCDGADNDCDGAPLAEEVDDDADGYMVCENDCNDADSTSYPNAPEDCDGADNNCNGILPPEEADDDIDGYMVCEGDCDDSQPSAYPGAVQACDGVADNDCDGFPDSNEVDIDGDTFDVCSGDCDDSMDSVYPGAPEAGIADAIEDGIDQDCDGVDWSWRDEIFSVSGVLLPDWDTTATVVDGNGASVLDQYLFIAFQQGTTEQERETLATSYGATINGTIPDIGYYLDFQNPQSFSQLETAVASINVEPNVSVVSFEYILEDWVGSAVLDPEHQSGNQGWYFDAIRWSDAWSLANLSDWQNEIAICVIDSHFDLDHPDLFGGGPQDTNYQWVGVSEDYSGFWAIDFVQWQQLASTSNPLWAHGTHVSGIAGANHNGSGVNGIGPEIRIFPLNVGLEDPEDLSAAALAAAIYYAKSTGVKVINLSLGAPAVAACADLGSEAALAESGLYHIYTALQFALAQDISVVVIAENEEQDASTYFPSCIPSVVTVAGTNSGDDRWDGSNWGSVIDIAAPSEDIYSTVPDDGYGFKTGTSMAAPIVSGAIATVRQVNNMLDATEAEELLVCTSDLIQVTLPVGHPDEIWPRLDILQAVREAADEAPPVPTLDTPYDGQTVVGEPVEISWIESAIDVEDEVYYRLYVEGSMQFVSEPGQALSGDLYNLVSGNTYSWRVDAHWWSYGQEIDGPENASCGNLAGESDTYLFTFYLPEDHDGDGDGYCENVEDCLDGTLPGDCDDEDPNAFPGAVEVEDGVDNDCDGLVDNTGDWHFSEIDSGDQHGNFVAIALDDDDAAHIAYRANSEELKYAYDAGIGWAISTVDSGSDVWYIDIAIDSAGYPHISYVDDDGPSFRHAWYDGSSWQNEAIAASGQYWEYGHTSIFIDEADGIHITYADGNAAWEGTYYAYFDGSTWSTEVVEEGKMGSTSVTLDESGYPHVAYYMTTPNNLRYAADSAYGWTYATVDATGEAGRHANLYLDSLGHPNIAYEEEDLDAVKYARWDGANWILNTIHTFASGWYIAEIGMDMDSSDQAHLCVAAQDYPWDYTMKYMVGVDATWTSETIGEAGRDPLACDLVLDSGESPHIVFFDDSYNQVVYAYFW